MYGEQFEKILCHYNYDFVYGNRRRFCLAETTQLEDPREEWRAIQEAMLREYLQTAQDVLEVSQFCFIEVF